MSDDQDDGKTGYGKPPKETRFKKGQSGNPKGRPKGTCNFATDVKELLQTPVPLKVNGKIRSVSTQEAALLRLREKGLKGDVRALDRLLALAQDYNGEDLSAAVAPALAQSDQDIIHDFVQRQQKDGGGCPTNTGDSGVRKKGEPRQKPKGQ